MSELLNTLHEADMIDDLDRAFGDWVAERDGDVTGLAAALASAEVGKGHVCLDLATASELLHAHDTAAPTDLAKTLAASKTVAGPGKRAPLVLDGNRLYLHRYWHYEFRLAAALLRMAQPVPDIDDLELAKYLRDLFPGAGDKEEPDRQALAAVIGVTRRLAIISGGPGTGKTTTVLKLIALAQRLEPELSVALAAPTGKAAGRLAEVIADSAVSKDVRERLPGEPQTLHRLLGYNPARQTVRHNAENPLPYDLVVVDEASMVDMGLMARLVDALAPKARLVLVGDRDQLASVEAGAVLGDICSVASGFAEPDAKRLETLLAMPVPRAQGSVSPISASIALLEHNYRFGEGAIGRFADAVIAGNASEALAAAAEGELDWRPLTGERMLAEALAEVTRECFRPVLDAGSPEEALARFNRFRLLAAERRGVFGVEGLNTRVESLLGVHAVDAWYKGRPVLITENDYELGLYNGDFGLAWPNEHDRLMVWVAATDGTLRAISPARLPAHETCYAMTVHKAQGSEFDRVALVLPPRESAVVTRELLYTAVTRARKNVEIWATETALFSAIERRIRRASGLSERLAGSGK
ncbi:MAG TPA: exodeoxyribonuclease V subunit alpha [Gammaproteobacteria bacterium]|nr:exodeoxyribonuclease V subunit alpha [Gammaproteobacteria bacterium]